jgi:hypothetical protein
MTQWPDHDSDGAIGHRLDPFGANADAVPNGNGEGRVVIVVLDISLWRLLKGLNGPPNFVF